MKIDTLDRSFRRIGARVRFGEGGLDVLRDGAGEFFRLDLGTAKAGGYEALDLQPRRRHLVLVAGDDRFLCGHDERHWFVAGLRQRSATTVEQAMDSLRPEPAREALRRAGIRHERRHDRRNPAFLRQGEWFFVPAPSFASSGVILRKEPLRRGRGKPHVADELARAGGVSVWVSRDFPNGLIQREYEELRRGNADLWARQQWRPMVRDAEAYVRGKVRHPDHATLVLRGWHRVALALDVASRQMAFLD